jgi:GAF domain-containing protein
LDQFFYLISFISILLGLALTEVAKGYASALKRRHAISIGVLTPLLALLFCLDIANFWFTAWSRREVFGVTLLAVFLSLTFVLIYYLAAAMIFPDDWDSETSLDEWFFDNNQHVVGGLIAANLLANLVLNIAEPVPLTGAYLAFLTIFAAWIGVLVALARSRRRATALPLLLVAIAVEFGGLIFVMLV